MEILDAGAIKAFIEAEEQFYKEATAADGLFPLAEEDVVHAGAVQRYRCWQRGPNSVVYLSLPELWRGAVQHADQEFLVYGDSRLTFAQVLSSAAALSRELRQYGARKGSVVAIAARNCPEFVIAFVAVTGFLAGVLLPVNAWWTAEELRYGLQDSGARLLIADRERLDRAVFFLADLGVQAFCIGAGSSPLEGGSVSFEDAVAAGMRRPPETHPAAVAQEDMAMLMYTSGTTSAPKGVVMSQRSVLAAINMIRLLNYRPDEPAQPQVVQLVPVPLFHVNGTHNMLLSGPCLGRKLVLMPKWNAAHALNLIQEERVNVLFGVPTMTYELLNHPDLPKFDTSSLKSIGGGGAPFSAPMIRQVPRAFQSATAGTGYGLTETNSTVTLLGGALLAARPSSVGRPVWNIDVCVLDPHDAKLPPEGIGEVCVHGAIIMEGYWQKPEKTKESFHFDNEGRLWFRTGDIGRLDEDGFLYIMDRAKDLIIRGGENISCAEVEAALFEHESVAEVAAFGVPDARLGEIVGVAVVFKAGVSAAPPSDADLMAHCRSQFAAFKVPAKIFKWPDVTLPRGATGKILKREIREQLLGIGRGDSKL